MSTSWQVKVGENLSRPYTMEQLRTKRRNGTIDESTVCTEDRGESFISIDELLEGERELESSTSDEDTAASDRSDMPAAPTRRLNRPARKSSRLQKALKSVNSSDAGAEDLLPQTEDRLAESEDPLPQTEAPLAGSDFDTTADDALLPELPDLQATDSGLPDEGGPPLLSEPEPEPSPEPQQQMFSGLSGIYRNTLEHAKDLAVEDRDAPEDSFYSGPSIDLTHSAAPAPIRTPRTPPARPQPKTSVRDAAARALAAESAARAEQSPPASEDLSRVVPGQRPGQPSADPPPQTRPRVSSLLVMLTGIPALGLVIWWFGFGRTPSVEDLTGGSFNLDQISGDATTVEELNARTQILSVQLARITKALASRDDDTEPLELPDMTLQTAPALPLMPFQTLKIPEDLAQLSSDYKDRYSKLVQEKGPNGSRLSSAIVDRHAVYLSHLATFAGSEGNTRAEALFQLSEWTKLLYLLQYGRLSAGGPAAQQATDEILAAANAGLDNIFPELKTGDMRFVDVFERCSEHEQARLLLVRYWYYKAVNQQAATAWLDQNLAEIDEQQHGSVKASIAEVTAIIGE